MQHFCRFHVGTLLARVENWMYFKIPTKGRMMSETVKDTCDSNGYLTPCAHSSYSDSDCVITVFGMYTFEHIQQTLCPDASTWTCSLLNEVCAYRRDWDSGSSYCNLMNAAKSGKDYSNKMSLCELEV